MTTTTMKKRMPSLKAIAEAIEKRVEEDREAVLEVAAKTAIFAEESALREVAASLTNPANIAIVFGQVCRELVRLQNRLDAIEARFAEWDDCVTTRRLRVVDDAGAERITTRCSDHSTMLEVGFDAEVKVQIFASNGDSVYKFGAEVGVAEVGCHTGDDSMATLSTRSIVSTDERRMDSMPALELVGTTCRRLKTTDAWSPNPAVRLDVDTHGVTRFGGGTIAEAQMHQRHP